MTAAARQVFLPHTDVSSSVRQAAESLNAHSVRLRRYLGQHSATGNTRRSAKEELSKLISEAVALQEII